MAGHRVGKRSVALPWSLKCLLSPTPLFPTPSPTLYSFPLSQHFSETLHGLVTIRAFSKQRLFRAKNTVRGRGKSPPTIAAEATSCPKASKLRPFRNSSGQPASLILTPFLPFLSSSSCCPEPLPSVSPRSPIWTRVTERGGRPR